MRQRPSVVMKWTVAQGYRNDDPAGDAIRAALPQHWAHREHQRALAHSDVAGTLRTIRDTASLACYQAGLGVHRIDGLPFG